eukprot:SAG22_NODE_20552_length_264_cov_1.987879_1_plen_49_part_10
MKSTEELLSRLHVQLLVPYAGRRSSERGLHRLLGRGRDVVVFAEARQRQ